MFLVMKIDKNSVYISKNTFKRHIDLLLIEEKDQFHMLLSKISTLLYTTKYYIMIEKIFVVIVCNL